MMESREWPAPVVAAAKAMHAYEEPGVEWEPWRESYLEMAEKGLDAATPLLCQPLQDENDRLRAIVAEINDWATTNHGGVKRPIDVWPGLAAALAAESPVGTGNPTPAETP